MSEFSYLNPMSEVDLDWVMRTEQAAYEFPWSRKGFERTLDGGLNYLFCDDENQPLGYACLMTVLDEVQLLNFCVAPESQRKGVGRAALQALLSQFSKLGFAVMQLEVRVSNPAVMLYESVGFKQDGVRPRYYPASAKHPNSANSSDNNAATQAREDALLMSCALGGNWVARFEDKIN